MKLMSQKRITTIKNEEAGIVEMEENNNVQPKKQGAGKIMEFLILFITSGAIAGLGSLLYGYKEGEIIHNTIMTLLGTGTVIFALSASEVHDLYFYKNKGKYGKFTILYLSALILSLLFPLLPVMGWPFLVIFVFLSLFSNSISGLVSGSVCLMLSIMLESGGSYNEFFIYFLSGLVGIMVFGRLNDTFKVGLPIFISFACLTVCLFANTTLSGSERISVSQFTVIAINLMVSFILLLIILKIFSNTMIHKYNDKYMEINDPECPLLVQLKEMSKEEYYHAIHTAYLGDKIAKQLKLNEMAVKSCGYYHRIGILRGENSWENVEKICKEYRIPPDARKALKEYISPDEPTLSKEATVVLFADCIVTSITRLFAKDPKAELDYEQIINTIFDNKLESGELNKSDISIMQLRKMRKIFSEEKLYYDFLR